MAVATSHTSRKLNYLAVTDQQALQRAVDLQELKTMQPLFPSSNQSYLSHGTATETDAPVIHVKESQAIML